MNSGFAREAQKWRLWLRRAVAGNPAQVQIMYGLAGERRLDEWEVPWLAGYEASKPVRVGNAAGRAVTLPILRSWPGSPPTGPSGVWSKSALRARRGDGAKYVTKSTTR